MSIIRTVRGDIPAEELGYAQCHEHLFIEKDKSAEINDVLLIDDFEKTCTELELYHNAGGRAVVDAQPVLSGRMAELEQRASERTDVHIIGSTGFHKTIFYYDDSYIFHDSEEKITELYIDEITEGMLGSKASGAGRTTAKAGMIKTAVGAEGIFADKTYEKLHTAAAQAQLQTGAPVMCHMDPGAKGAEVADFYLQKGVPAAKLWLAHLDRAEYDVEVHKDVLARGVYLEYDTIAREKYHSDDYECELITKLINAGYGRQLLLGLDTTRARLKSYGSIFGLDYIIADFIPMLRRYGAADAQIEELTVKNPAAALSMLDRR